MGNLQAGYDPGAEALRTTVTPNFQMVQPQSVESRLSGNKAYQLAESLGSVNATLQKYNDQHEALKEQEQARKLPWYVEQFKQDYQGGAVSQAQVRERFPETVPVIASRIAESMGASQGEDAVKPIIQTLLENDDLRLNTEARKKYIEEQKQNFMTQLSGGENDFYSAGFLKAVDAQLNQYDNQFNQQTAAYQQKVQADAFAKTIETTFLNGGDMGAVDAAWKASSSLSNLERNKLVVDTVTKTAFAHDDPSMLDKIPTRFLNADTRAEIARTKQQIQSQRITNFNFANALEERARTEAIRKDKVEMIDTVMGGGVVDPAKYRNNPESFNFALSVKDAARLPEATSAANAEKIRQDILKSSTIGVTATTEQFVDGVLLNTTLNPADKKKLIEEMPKLVEGNLAMKDEAVTSALSLRINPRLESLEKSTNATIQTLLAGRNLRAEVMGTFDQGIRDSFRAEYQDTGKWPTGHRKLELIDLQVAKTERLLENLTKVDGSNNQAPAANNPTPAANSKPADNSKSSKGQKKIPVPGMPGVYRYEN